MPTSDRLPLTRAAVLQAALTVIDRGGLRACTMRGVATELDAEAMSLYWHVENKDDLLDGVIALVLEDVAIPSRAPAVWHEHVVIFAHRFRAVILSHPHVVPLLAERPATAYAATRRAAVGSITSLKAAGFSPDQAVDITRMVVRFVFGSTMMETAFRPADAGPPADHEPEFQALVAAIADDEPGRLFTLGLETMLGGIEASR